MTKRVLITALTLLGGAADEHTHQPPLAYPGSVLDLDDNTAGLLVVAGKARYDKDAKLKNTAKEFEAAADAAARAQTTPEASMAALIAQAVAAAMKAQAPASATA